MPVDRTYLVFPQVNEGLLSLEELDLSCCNLTDGGLPEDIGAIPKQFHTINADWSNDSICNSLFRNISSLQHDISVSDSLSLRVFTSWLKNIPSWFHHQGMGASILVNLPENWLFSTGEKKFGVRLLYKDESELHIGIRRSRYALHSGYFLLLKLFPAARNKGHKYKLGL